MQKLERIKYSGIAFIRKNGRSPFDGSISLSGNNQLTLTTKGVKLLKLTEYSYNFDIYEHNKSLYISFSKNGEFLLKRKKTRHNCYWSNLGKSLMNFIQSKDIKLQENLYPSARKSVSFFLKKRADKYQLITKEII